MYRCSSCVIVTRQRCSPERGGSSQAGMAAALTVMDVVGTEVGLSYLPLVSYLGLFVEIGSLTQPGAQHFSSKLADQKSQVILSPLCRGEAAGTHSCAGLVGLFFTRVLKIQPRALKLRGKRFPNYAISPAPLNI